MTDFSDYRNKIEKTPKAHSRSQLGLHLVLNRHHCVLSALVLSVNKKIYN